MEKLIKKISKRFGYEFQHQSEQQAFLDNFVNLAKAYESLLNKTNCVIDKNELRPILIAKLIGTLPTSAYNIVQALAKCKDISGAVCEFGVAQGSTSALIANEIKSCDKILHLFDSFEGLPKPTQKDKLKDDIFSLGSMEAYAGEMSCPEEMVRARLTEIDFPSQRYVVHKGFIENVLDNNTSLPEQISFAYVDFDLYEPIRVTLEYLHRTTSSGAIIIVDDYDFFSTGVKTAVDEFIEEKNLNGKNYDCYVPDHHDGFFAMITKLANN